MVSCNGSRKQFEGTWTGYWDGDYVELAIMGSTWSMRSFVNNSGTCTYNGNTITLIHSDDGSTFLTGTVAGNGMAIDAGRWKFTLFRR
jgi:hypothetical protein